MYGSGWNSRGESHRWECMMVKASIHYEKSLSMDMSFWTFSFYEIKWLPSYKLPELKGVYICMSFPPTLLSLSLTLFVCGFGHGCGWGVCVCVACVCDFGNWSRLIKAQSVIKGQSNCSSCANYKQYLTQVTYFI